MNALSRCVFAVLAGVLVARPALADPPVSLALTEAIRPVSVAPGGTIELVGVLRSRDEGAVIDALTTAAGEGEVPLPGGLFDLEAGGLTLVARDLHAHRFRLAATGSPGEACVEARVASPCLVNRVVPLAHARFLSAREFARSLSGELRMQVIDPPPAPLVRPESARRFGAWSLLGSLALLAVIALRRRSKRPDVRIRAAADRIARALERGEPVERALAPGVRALGARATTLAAQGDLRALETLASYVRSLEARLDRERAQRSDKALHDVLRGLDTELACALEARAEVDAL